MHGLHVTPTHSSTAWGTGEITNRELWANEVNMEGIPAVPHCMGKASQYTRISVVRAFDFHTFSQYLGRPWLPCRVSTLMAALMNPYSAWAPELCIYQFQKTGLLCIPDVSWEVAWVTQVAPTPSFHGLVGWHCSIFMQAWWACTCHQEGLLQLGMGMEHTVEASCDG